MSVNKNDKDKISKDDDNSDKIDVQDFSIKMKKNKKDIATPANSEKVFDTEIKENQKMHQDYVKMLKERKGEHQEDFKIFDGERIKAITFPQKWDNFWYHYKVHVLIIGFASILALLWIWGIVFQEKFDTSILMLTEYPIEQEKDRFGDIFSQYVEDFDGNNQAKAEFAILQMAIKNPEFMVNEKVLLASQAKLVADFTSYHSLIYLLDDSNYEEMKSEYGFVFKDLTEYSDAENIKKDKFMLSGSGIGEKFTGYDVLLEELCLVIVDFDSLDEEYKNDEKFVKRYNESLEVMKNIINNTPVNEATE